MRFTSKGGQSVFKKAIKKWKPALVDYVKNMFKNSVLFVAFSDILDFFNVFSNILDFVFIIYVLVLKNFILFCMY